MKSRSIHRSFISTAPALVRALCIALISVGGTAALADPDSATPLTLMNGWTNAPFGTHNAAVQIFNGIVHFKGAIANGTTNEAFVLPVGFRPSTNVYLNVDLCDATKGRLFIEPSGAVYVYAETNFSNAQCFTSLDGATFAPNSTSFTPVKLINGWTNTPYGTSNAAVRNINGLVHFKGAIASSTSNNYNEPFILPKGFRPSNILFIPVDLCDGTLGVLTLYPNGSSLVVDEEGGYSNASCFTSLDGAKFAAAGAPNFKSLTLINGWFSSAYKAGPVAAYNANSKFPVAMRGAISTSGTNPTPFILPLADRPTADVYVPVTLGGANNGRLFIQTNGVVTVEAEGGFFYNAKDVTSLENVTFLQ